MESRWWRPYWKYLELRWEILVVNTVAGEKGRKAVTDGIVEGGIKAETKGS